MTIAKENRIDHMKYMPDMEVIESDVMDKVISSMNECDFTKFTDDDVLAVLEKDILEPRDFECLLSPVAQNHLEAIARKARSEEHTSELQSRQYLVCRLLLEKKKTSLPLQPRPNFTYDV